jgi:hypothetical protein
MLPFYHGIFSDFFFLHKMSLLPLARHCQWCNPIGRSKKTIFELITEVSWGPSLSPTGKFYEKEGKKTSNSN